MAVVRSRHFSTRYTGMIRELTVEELPLIYRLGKMFYEEGKLPGKFDNDVFLKTWTKFLQSGIGRIFGAFQGEEFVGALACMTTPDMYDGQKVAIETFWYVFPEFRGQGVRLMKHYENWAKNNGVSRVLMGAIAGLHDEELGSFYERCGYRRLETTYSKTI
jgi:GNAT superfamily N-acetyltransferase